MTWHSWRCHRSIRRASHTLEGWIKVLSIRIPLFTLKTHRQALYFLKAAQDYNKAQRLVKIGTLLLSLGQGWKQRHGKRGR